VLAGADVKLWGTANELHVNDRVVQETSITGISALQPLSKNRVSATGGGDGAVKEEVIGAFGLQASAATLSQFIGSNSVSGIGERQPSSYRSGSIDGARTIAYSMNELDWALTLNTNEYGGYAAFEDLVSWKMLDLWNDYALA